jgi:DNA-binding NarL/FixJ family response regulator
MDVLIIDPHALSRLGLKQLIGELHGDALIGEAENDAQARHWLQTRRAPDLILIDPHTEGREPASQLAAYRTIAPPSRLAALIQSTSVGDVDALMRAGADACICKSAPLGELQEALGQVMMGKSYWPKNPQRPAWDLTPRQREVLRLIGEGYSNRQIADWLGLTEGTVKLHVTGILKSLGVRNRTQAALLLRRNGMAQPELQPAW